MNAPSHPRAGLRDPFTAFVCDDATADMLRPVAVEHGWSPEKVNKGGLRNAVQSLSVSASPNILFVDLSESADPLNDINALAEVCEPGTIVIAAGQVNDVRLYRDLVAGPQDYLSRRSGSTVATPSPAQSIRRPPGGPGRQDAVMAADRRCGEGSPSRQASLAAGDSGPRRRLLDSSPFRDRRLALDMERDAG